ncbi:suppressor of fused domain protein [Rhodoferax sp. AJA081-3]|uniref:suppressor of fused domain protein n=1 Tax=Rhodoferax sp. AJA081-3 TaxID=2752316 RepID=UPI001AE04F14|nr:suppressor of fused domain protein [Rhodoferax sp. AJA081-3]QTN28786.1 suppressor of fused domain protein [Rhodoferax sp. AJA081-3]
MRQLVGGNTSVTAYYDEANANKIHIFSSSNSDGIVAATVGLMEINQSDKPGVEIYSEIIMDQRGHDERISNVLSTIAFCVMKDCWNVAPGVVFHDVVRMYVPGTELPHVMFTAPFQWNTMSKLSLSAKTIYPLVAIPISEAEAKVAGANAGQDLEAIWVKQSTDVLDWGRKSAA